MAIKLVAIDLDDTLLDSCLRVSEATMDVLRRVNEQGVLVTLATGRMFRSARPYALRMGMDVPLITYQGAMIRFAVSEEPLIHCTVSSQLAWEVSQLAREAGYHYQAYMERLTTEGEAYARLAGVSPVIQPALRDLLKQREPTKVLIISDDLPELQRMEQTFKGRYDNQLYITRSKPNYLEILNCRSTKGQGLLAVSEYYGIDRRDVMAIGDSYNDIEMLKFAGTAVVVANAPPEVKGFADHLTASNDDEGVAQALERWVLTAI